MNCPLCIDEVLDVTHRGGIEVDVCPRCRGVWLDRGELDRLVADSGAAAPVAAVPGGGGPTMETSKNKKNRKDKKKDKRSRIMDLFEEVLDI